MTSVCFRAYNSDPGALGPHPSSLLNVTVRKVYPFWVKLLSTKLDKLMLPTQLTILPDFVGKNN